MLILIFISFGISQIIAQTSLDSLEYGITLQAPNKLFSNFDKQLNTYYINTGINYAAGIDRFQFLVYENFRSTFVESGTKSIRDEQYFHLNGKYLLTEKLRPGVSVKSSILSDDRQLGINQATVNQVTIYTEIDFLKNFYFTPYGGYSDNRQVGEDDTGPVYGFEGVARNLFLSNISINSDLKFENEDISPRKNTIRFFNLGVSNQFNPLVQNFINVRYSRSRKDFYFFADSVISAQFNVNNNIESRTESIFILEDKLSYNKFLDIFSLEISGRLNLRSIDRDTRYRSLDFQSTSLFDTEIEELGIGFESSVFYRTEIVDAAIRINYVERDEKHLTKRLDGVDESFYEQRSESESRKNNNSGRATISFFSNLHLSRSDRIGFSLYHSKLKYDTPSQNNDDDRDEILTIARLRYSKFLSPFFEAFVNLEGTNSHLVYLFAARSANNYKNRILRLSTGGHYRGAKFSSLNHFEVAANYTIYDFEDIASNLRSISFRQFTATDSTQWKLTKNFSFIINAYVKLTDQGDLNWNEFSERPTRYLKEIFADPKFGLTYDAAFFAIGMRYFSLQTFNYMGSARILDTEFLSIGPLAEIVIGSTALYLKMLGWYEFITTNNVADKERANLIVEMNWKF